MLAATTADAAAADELPLVGADLPDASAEPALSDESAVETGVETAGAAADVELDVEPDVAAAIITSSSSSSASLPCVGIVMSAGLRPAAARVVRVDVGDGGAAGDAIRVAFVLGHVTRVRLPRR